MVDFAALGSAIESQFSLGENKLRSLDLVKDGHTTSYGRLGAFADKFDQSAERSYTEDGFFKNDLYNPKPRQMEIWMQEPELTILVKKRAFNSLAENYRTDLLSEDERLFIRATKFLFQNKCKQIAAYERLTKIESVVNATGYVDSHLLPVIFTATDTLSTAFDALGILPGFSKFKDVIDRVRTIVNLSDPRVNTSWLTNVQNSFQTDLGQGTGVIEFTTALNVSTTTSVNFGQGSFTITLADPHNLMRVTNNDIEQAIADATNTVIGNSFIQLGLEELNKGIQEDKVLLNEIRNRRGASSIDFIVNPDTFLGKRVRALLSNSGTEIIFEGSMFSVDIDPGYLKNGDILGNDGVDTGSGSKPRSGSEFAIFSRIVRSTFNAMQINQNSRTASKKHNAKTNSLRKKLRLHYGSSKSIIQPMDAVHIFINSRTSVDQKIIGGLQNSFTALGFEQTAGKALNNIRDFFSAGSDSSVEKAMFVGKDFPNWLWQVMRNHFISDKSGTQVFAGLVKSSHRTFDVGSGTYALRVNGGDNSTYFDFGIVNYKPALDVWNGSLYDPITPFDIKFDQSTGLQKDKVPALLQENQDLFKSAFVKYKNGVYVGKKPTTNNFIQDTERVQNDSIRRVFYDPDGLVYKWKEGIGTLTMKGNNYQESPSSNISVPPLTVDPFAGQNLMNAVSLLVTGEPYNFATFYKAASQFDNFGRDASSGADPSVSYFRNFQSDIKKRNLLYGNFVPFKKLSVDADSYKNILNKQIRASGFDNELNDLLSQKADLVDKISVLNNFGNGTSVSIDVNSLSSKLKDIDIKISAKQQQISTELNQINKPVSIVGNDISLDYDPFLPTNPNKLNNMYKMNKELRRKVHFLTRRMSWKVRANEDVNLFIVDDSYDKDYDIQAFEKAFTNPQLFNSEYKTIKEIIDTIRQTFDFEIFADSQGHIQIRPPQYNKIPSSVFYRMIRLKDDLNIQLYPQFIEELYVDQINSVKNRMEVIEDEIRMYGLALAISNDAELEQFLASHAVDIKANTSSTKFHFISYENSGATEEIVLKQLATDDDPISSAELFSNGLNAVDTIQSQAQVNNILSATSRTSLLKETIDAFSSQKASIATILGSQNIITRKDMINDRLLIKTGQKFDLTQLFPNSAQLNGNVSAVDLLKIFNEISERVAERQRILKIAANAIKNAKESLSLIQDKNHTTSKLLVPNLFNNSQIPAGFENLIEDESYDDYGPNSGKRYVIKDQFIKSLEIVEESPPYTAVEVHGKFGDNFDVNLPQDLSLGAGNALSTAVAVDYDMWRMYGVRLPTSVPAPFLTDPDSQCAPFAVALLNAARKQTNKGSINLFGNEFMQVGETVYLESQDTLYYVESVSHDFTYGRNFSTTLNVSHGHMPGEYIPTYLDTVGKILYKNKDISSLVSKRDDTVNNDQHIGTIVGNLGGSPFSSDNSAQVSIMTGTFADENRQALNNILAAAENVFNTTGANYTPILEIRVFYASTSGFPRVSSTARSLANAIKEFLVGGNNMFELAKTKQPDALLKKFAGQIKVISVDSNDSSEFRSPSTQSYSMARRSLGKKQPISTTSGIAYQIDKVIYDHVVDCWIMFQK